MDVLAAFKVFVCVADSGGFSPAARELGVGQPAVSKQMAALEQHLGTRLFNRSSHAFSLSEDGLALLDRARFALDAMDDAQDLHAPAAHAGRGLAAHCRAGGVRSNPADPSLD